MQKVKIFIKLMIYESNHDNLTKYLYPRNLFPYIMTLCEQDLDDILYDMRVAYKGTFLEGYVETIENYRCSLEWRLSGGNHITPESQIFNVNYNHKVTREYNGKVEPKKTIELEKISKNFVLENLKNKFDSDKELIEFFVNLAEDIPYCDSSMTENQLKDHYRQIREKTDIDDVPHILENQKRDALDKLFIKEAQWENPPDIGMFGIHKIRIGDDKEEYNVVVKITDSYEDRLGNMMYKYDIVYYDDSISEQINHWLLNSDEPITPMCENSFEFVDNRPNF